MPENQNSQAPTSPTPTPPTPPTPAPSASIPPAPTPPPPPLGRKRKRALWITILGGVIATIISTTFSYFIEYGLIHPAIDAANEKEKTVFLNNSDRPNSIVIEPIPATTDVGTSQLTSDLRFRLQETLENAGCTETTIEVTDLTIDSITKPDVEKGEIVFRGEVTGQATILYEGRSERVTYTSRYHIDPSQRSTIRWVFDGYELSSYALFPPAVQEYKAAAASSESATADTTSSSAV